MQRLKPSSMSVSSGSMVTFQDNEAGNWVDARVVEVDLSKDDNQTVMVNTEDGIIQWIDPARLF